MFGLMVVLSLIRLLAFPLLVLVSLLTMLPLFWDDRIWGQVDLIHPVGNVPSCRGFCSVPGPFNLFKGLSCGESFWLYSLLVLFIWVWTIFVLYVMLVVCWMVVLVLFF